MAKALRKTTLLVLTLICANSLSADDKLVEGASPRASSLPPVGIAEIKGEPLSLNEISYIAFKKGVTSYQQQQFDGAITALTEVPELGAGYLSLYKHWFLGKAYMELGKFKEAEPEFHKVMQGKVSKEMTYQAQFELGEAALRQKKYKESQHYLQPLERKWRYSYRSPEVIYRLLSADLKIGNRSRACNRARKLYTKYPAHPLVLDWGSDLMSVSVGGVKLGCGASDNEFASRVRSLQYSGEAEKAHREIMALLANAKDDDKLRLDLVLANFLVSEGSVDDALNLLIRYYPTQKSSISYLNLLGKAAARSGEYQTAVGAYERVFELNSKGRVGREALFRAAYLSYQFQDYDGAVRKFQQFIKSNPRSGLSRDAKWHLAWLQYLRSDYRGAIEKFADVAKSSGGRGRRRSTTVFLEERLAYWSAMAHVRLSEFSKARSLFAEIIQKNPYSYYGLLADSRLASLASKPEGEPDRTPSSFLPKMAEIVENSSLIRTPALVTEDQESEESMAESEEGEAASEEQDSEDSSESIAEFKDPVARARLELAQSLIRLDLKDLARWELLEVERHTRNRQYLRSLLSAYEGIGSYNRAASISELSFGRERGAGGLEGARGLWLAMYPEAFKKSVDSAVKRFGGEREWVFAIMRTESLFRPEVISPVGARGLMQLMPNTARNLIRLSGDENQEDLDLLNPDTNIRLGAQYLARLSQKFKGSLPLAAASYNAGPHRVESWLVSFGHLDTDEFVEHIPFLETRNYVKKIVRHHTMYRRLYAKDDSKVSYMSKSLGVSIPTRAATRESWESL